MPHTSTTQSLLHLGKLTIAKNLYLPLKPTLCAIAIVFPKEMSDYIPMAKLMARYVGLPVLGGILGMRLLRGHHQVVERMYLYAMIESGG